MNVTTPRQVASQDSSSIALSLDTAASESRCPQCGESKRNMFAWLDMERVRCQTCGHVWHLWVNRSD